MNLRYFYLKLNKRWKKGLLSHPIWAVFGEGQEWIERRFWEHTSNMLTPSVRSWELWPRVCSAKHTGKAIRSTRIYPLRLVTLLAIPLYNNGPAQRLTFDGNEENFWGHSLNENPPNSPLRKLNERSKYWRAVSVATCPGSDPANIKYQNKTPPVSPFLVHWN